MISRQKNAIEVGALEESVGAAVDAAMSKYSLEDLKTKGTCFNFYRSKLSFVILTESENNFRSNLIFSQNVIYILFSHRLEKCRIIITYSKI